MFQRFLVMLPSVLLVACAPEGTRRNDSGQAEPRIVCIAPAAAEMLGALELLDRVVAVGEFGPWPAEIEGLPRAGGYASPNVEQVLALRADWLVSTASEAATPAHSRLETLGVRVLALDTSTYEGVFSSLARLGMEFGRAAEAERLAAQLRREIAEVEARASGLPRRRVLFVVGRDPLYVAGPGSHADRLIAIAGGENVASDSLSAYQQVSVESVLERMPDVIVDTSDNRPGAQRGRDAGSWSRWPFLPAVRDGRVYQVDPGQLVIPGVRLAEMARVMSRLVHPEQFGEPQAADFRPVSRTTHSTDPGA